MKALKCEGKIVVLIKIEQSKPVLYHALNQFELF